VLRDYATRPMPERAWKRCASDVVFGRVIVVFGRGRDRGSGRDGEMRAAADIDCNVRQPRTRIQRRF